MLKLENIKSQAVVAGIEPSVVVTVRFVESVGTDAITVNYRLPSGESRERMLFRSDELNLSLAEAGRPWAFDARGDLFKLVAEAYRINLAHLFDPMMAVHTSNVEPLPHQITAVYESMLPRQPLRYVLADDPGAGKTIMAGLLIRELLMRSDAKRVLIVAPGSLVEQWQDELSEKFGLIFSIFSRHLEQQSHSGNCFDDNDLLIARLDQLSRAEDLQAKLGQTRWDLIVVDEAHKLSANWFGSKLNETKRFKLGKLLGSTTRHFLLMTATPHNGKEEDFQLFLSLLDSDRFYGKFRDGAHKVDVSDLMRRMVKEELLKFDGSPLFPERCAYTVNYTLSDSESALYTAVTTYVKEEMNRADRLADGTRRGAVGFALTSLQRRLASSPEAIYQSLRRRHERLDQQLRQLKIGQRGQSVLDDWASSTVDNFDDAAEEMSGDAYEEFEEAVVDQATAAQTIQELEAEIVVLADLEERARNLVHSGQDRKWEELSRLLQNTPEMRDSAGRQRKLIIFSEHRDTLNYLVKRVGNVLGSQDAVDAIHGGVRREDRRKIQEQFRNDPVMRVLIATDAAGEGVNLQNANLMVNYDLPWNPNRLEQRFGRIHRIGQTEVCHLWNIIAGETREGDVFTRLFEKLEIERAALGGRVFDILGEVFENKSLREMLIEAIRYGEDPDVRERLHKRVEGALDTAHLREIIERDALCKEVMNEERLFAVREQMERAEARKLQPYFIRSFFNEAFAHLNGELRAREIGRWEINHVPALIRERDRQISGRDHRYEGPVLLRYERICFEREQVRPKDRPGAPMASLIHPGHPLMHAVTDLILEQHRNTLKRGAIMVSPDDMSTAPRLCFILDHAIREGADPTRMASRRLQFVEIDANGNAVNAGWAPHLDLTPISAADLELVRDVVDGQWLQQGQAQNLEQIALAHAAQQLVPEHYDEIRGRREKDIDLTLRAVQERLVKEINYWSDRYIKLQEDIAAGKDVRLTLENVRRTIDDLTARLETRKKELAASRDLISASPLVVGGALVIPNGLLTMRRGQQLDVNFCIDADARRRIERIAMQAVIDAESRLGHKVIDVSAEKCGWDVTSQPRPVEGKLPNPRHIEVKGRAKGQTTITVTKNEVFAGFNQGEKFVLAIVLVDGEQHEGPYYITTPFSKEPDWAVTSINLDLSELLSRATSPEAVPVTYQQ